MKLNITPDHFQELIKKSYSLDILFLLRHVHEGYDVAPLCEASVKIKAIYNSLLRKGLITEEEKLSTLGIDILDFVSKKTNKKFVKKKVEKSEFDEWWEIYPSTDAFVLGTRKFSGTRGLRINKDKCRLEFVKILEEGTFTKEDIMCATVYDIKQRKSNSLKKGSNQLTFLQNSLTYLNQRAFEPFISLSKDKENYKPSPTIGSMDI